jgi:hypothetical protein
MADQFNYFFMFIGLLAQRMMFDVVLKCNKCNWAVMSSELNVKEETGSWLHVPY